jgi:O-succinylbenzoic acid--CoA ligase
MDVVTPLDWIEGHASADYHRPALEFSDGVVSYGQLLDQVHSRTSSLRGDVVQHHVVPVIVGLDLPSIVEVVAVMGLGACPLPQLEGSFHSVGTVAANDAVISVATSGTSGALRIVPLTMANIAASVEASRARLGTTRDDRWLLCLPLNHIGGLSVLFRMFEVGGMAIVSPFSPHISEVVARTTPSVVSLVPTMVRRLLNGRSDALASIGTILVGGARVDRSIAQTAADSGVSLTPTYGMTEASSQVATAFPGEPWIGAGFVGQPLEGFTVEVEPDGVLVIDGPAVFGGYLGDEPRSSGFRTSDIGGFDSQGNLTIVGRADDIIITGGENVSLAAVEREIRGFEGVSEAVVVGVPDPEWGTAVCVMVVADRDIPSLKEGVADRLAAHEIPKRWCAVDAIPLMPNGKHDIASIRAILVPG